MNALFQEKSLITLKETVCGAGYMILAFADALNQAGYAPHRYLWVSATGIEPVAAGITYIQLSLCGVVGEVAIGNAFRNEWRRILYTPGHFIQRIGSAALMFIREVQADVMRLSRGALLTVFTVELTVQQEMHLQNYS